MAERIRKRHQEDVRRKIQASQLVNLLQNHALAGGEISSTRIDSAKFLLSKIIGNPPQEITGAGGEALFPRSVEVKLVKPGG